MAEFVVVHLLDEHQVSDRFTSWPLHVTLLPPFQAETISDVKTALGDITEASQAVAVQVGEFAQFGAKRIAQKLIPNPELLSLHHKLLQAARLQGWQMDGRYIGDYYTPHITRKLGRDYDGTHFIIDKLAVVESLGQGYRQVVAELPLKENA